MGWRGVVKGMLVTVLMIASILGLWYGVFLVLSGGGWRFGIGLAVFVAAFRGIILGYDIMWGRPPAFSKRPWERPWEHEPPGPR